MSQQQDNFSGGFILGAIIGGAIGGVLGAILINPNKSNPITDELQEEPKVPRPRKRPLRVAIETPTGSEQSIEAARQSLEAKIAQLNEAIDDVRQQINTVNSQPEIKIDR
jgi:hypothetical protein